MVVSGFECNVILCVQRGKVLSTGFVVGTNYY